MYCKNCGMLIEDNTDVCPTCNTNQFDDNGDAISKAKKIISKIETTASKQMDGPLGDELEKIKRKMRKKVYEPSRKKIENALINKAKRYANIGTKILLDIIGK